MACSEASSTLDPCGRYCITQCNNAMPIFNDHDQVYSTSDLERLHSKNRIVFEKKLNMTTETIK